MRFFKSKFKKLNPLKKLASQTAIYGVSSIVGRFLNYLLVPLYTRFFSTSEYGVVSEFYAYTGFFAVLLTFGMETGYFRFSSDNRYKGVYDTILSFLTIVSIGFLILIYLLSGDLAVLLHYEGYEHYFVWFAFILTLDTLGALPFAKLRQEENARRFALIKLVEIAVNIGLNVFFVMAKYQFENGSNGILASFYNPQIGVGYIFIANLVSSVFKLLLLSDKLIISFSNIDFSSLRKIVIYSFPMVIIGFAGIINEMLDRSMMKFLLPGTAAENLSQLGIYSACYKISIVMSLFIQAFRFAAEPFFFSQAKNEQAPKLYADVMRWFVWFCAAVFIVVTIYTEQFGLFVGKDFRSGLFIVPILLMANLMLGIYVNLSVWYKLTDNTFIGALVSIFGALITIILLTKLVPVYGYVGAAWATLFCYTFMVLVSYALGKRYFPVPYDLVRIISYIVLCVLVWIMYVAYFENQPLFMKITLFAGSLIALLMIDIRTWIKIIKRA
jgi:O-antigen/teichoic acid export membrane protein